MFLTLARARNAIPNYARLAHTGYLRMQIALCFYFPSLEPVRPHRFSHYADKGNKWIW